MVKCPICGNDFDEYTGRRPKKFCSDPCKVKFWNAFKKRHIEDLTNPTTTNEVKPPETTNVTIDTRSPFQKRYDELKQQNLEKLRKHE